MSDSVLWSQIFNSDHARDVVGYGGETPTRDHCWPNRARIALQFVVNYEEVSCM